MVLVKVIGISVNFFVPYTKCLILQKVYLKHQIIL